LDQLSLCDGTETVASASLASFGIGAWMEMQLNAEQGLRVSESE
jgi:hypothetical protein